MNSESGSIRFNDGAIYERYMGQWSRLAGDEFLDWLAPPPGRRWLDVGCGNGAFTEMLFDCCAPASVDGIDPSEEQLAYARAQPRLNGARFHQGDAMALPCVDDSFDAAVMPLVIFFVPDPPRGVAEMARVVRPGGSVSAYAWDLTNGGFPYEAVLAEIRELDLPFPAPPNPEASRLDVLGSLWTDAGLDAVEVCEIVVQRSFADFDAYWATALEAPSVGQTLASMPPEALAHLKERARARLGAKTDGEIRCGACANAVKGLVAK